MAFVDKLGAKCEMIRESYRELLEREEPYDISLNSTEQKMFSSMERFHKLSHTRFRFLSINKHR